jgi:aldehyde dehydrogenase (NAD+)
MRGPCSGLQPANGDDPDVAAARSSHPDIDMISFTGSTRAGVEVAKNSAEQVVVGDPNAERTTIGPVVSDGQWSKVYDLIQPGIDHGATLETGGTAKPEGLNSGYYVKPTVFSHVTNDMRIAHEEIFGPVLSLIGYEDDDDAGRIANDTS